jgi:hypothetical protein
MKKRNLLTWLILLLSAQSFLLCQKIELPKREYMERMAGYNKTIVFTDESVPNSCVMTYFQNGARYTDANYLVKLLPGIELDGEVIMPSKATDISVEDFPGGVTAKFKLKNIQIETKIRPLFVGRGSEFWDGAALYEIKTNPITPLILQIGSGKKLSLLPHTDLVPGKDREDLRDDTVASLYYFKSINEKTIYFKSGEENISVLMKSSDLIEVDSNNSGASKVKIKMLPGSGNVLIAFSNNENRAFEIGKMDADTSRDRGDKYYNSLLQSSCIETPDKNMNDAFRSAIYNLEYAWLEPLGWSECLHHWYALFQQQVSAAAEWIGQSDRSKASILEQAHHLMDGNIPQFMPDKIIKRDFGGSNQYWAWQVRHYLKFSGDKAFAKEIIPYLDTVVAQSLKDYDKDGDMLPGWGLQIGNQEDFIGNPGDGTNPSIELINMFRTRSELSGCIGDTKDAELWKEKADQIVQKLHDKLWLNDLGRFAFYSDPTGSIRLDGQYETFLYPIIWDIVDPLDQYTGLRHLLDRLTGKNGSIFCSNNFSWHAIGTWGMQNGEAQQPWAAWAFSKSGFYNKTWLPLKTMADWTMDINHRGAWPEISSEPLPAYFTPPCGLYIASIVEALYGLKINVPENFIEIAPSFPDTWSKAKLTLPEFKVEYIREGNKLSYTFETLRALEKRVRWILPPAKITRCLVNGKEADFKIDPGVGHITLCIDGILSQKVKIEIDFSPIKYDISYPASIVEGDSFQLKVKGLKIDRIDDRCKVLGSWNYDDSPNSISAAINTGLLKPYEKFGQLGQLNFSRRTFFVHGRLSKDLDLWFPVDLTILPDYEAATNHEVERNGNGYSLNLQIRNNTNNLLKGTAVLHVYKQEIPFSINIAPRSEMKADIIMPPEIVNSLSSGDNEATLVLSGKYSIPVTIISCDINVKPMVQLLLPENDLFPDTLWDELRIMQGFPHIFFMFTNYGRPKPMAALEDVSEIPVPEIPGLTFRIPHRKFIPVSHRSGKVSYKLGLPPGKYSKLFLLVIPLVDNHDIFSEVGRVSAYSKDRIVYNRTLCYPGDLDYWVPNVNPYTFATFREPRTNRFELLPQLKTNQSDWAEGKPPAFPEPKYWSTSIPVVTKSCLMDVIEIDLSNPMELDYLVFESMGAYPAFGIVGAVAQMAANNK